MLFFGINLLLRCLFSERHGCVCALCVSACVMCCCCTEDSYVAFRLGMSVCSVCFHVWCVMRLWLCTPCFCMCGALLWACLCVPCVMCYVGVSMCSICLHVWCVVWVCPWNPCVYMYDVLLYKGLGPSLFRLAPTHLLWGIWISSISTVVYFASGNHAKFVSTMTSWLLLLCCGCKIRLPLSMSFSFSLRVSWFHMSRECKYY